MPPLLPLILACAPGAVPEVMVAIAAVESSGGFEYAIGVVGGHLERRATSRAEAEVTAHALAAGGWNYSVGAMQVNQSNFERYGLTIETAFDPGLNVAAGAAIFQECHDRAVVQFPDPGRALDASLSCYYSGNWVTGTRVDAGIGTSYVQRVRAAWPELDEEDLRAASRSAESISCQGTSVQEPSESYLSVISPRDPRNVTGSSE